LGAHSDPALVYDKTNLEIVSLEGYARFSNRTLPFPVTTFDITNNQITNMRTDADVVVDHGAIKFYAKTYVTNGVQTNALANSTCVITVKYVK
jgi:hypothetical protein